jgi:hypothetical protein
MFRGGRWWNAVMDIEELGQQGQKTAKKESSAHSNSHLIHM